jgi:hypothetical protein
MKFSAADTYGSLYIFEKTERLRHNRKHKTTIDCLTPRITLNAEKSASVSHEVPLILFRPKVHYRVVPIMNQMNPIHALKHLLPLTCISTLTSHIHLRALRGLFPQVSPAKPSIHLSHACHMRASSHHRINIWGPVQITKAPHYLNFPKPPFLLSFHSLSHPPTPPKISNFLIPNRQQP